MHPAAKSTEISYRQPSFTFTTVWYSPPHDRGLHTEHVWMVAEYFCIQTMTYTIWCCYCGISQILAPLTNVTDLLTYFIQWHRYFCNKSSALQRFPRRQKDVTTRSTAEDRQPRTLNNRSTSRVTVHSLTYVRLLDLDDCDRSNNDG